MIAWTTYSEPSRRGPRTATEILAGDTTLADVAVPVGALALVVLVLRALKTGARMQGYQAASVPIAPPAV